MLSRAEIWLNALWIAGFIATLIIAAGMTFLIIRKHRNRFVWPRTADAKTHDFVRGMVGHDIVGKPIDPEGLARDVDGWGPILGPRLKVGDFVKCRAPANETGQSVYRVKEVKYHHDPNDMFHAILWWAGRTDAYHPKDVDPLPKARIQR